MMIRSYPNKRNHRKVRRGLLVFLLAGVFSIMTLAAAGDGGAAEKGPADIKLKPIPGSRYEAGHDFRKDAERHYHLIGIVDDVQDEGIVVNDSFFKKAPRAIISGAGKGSRVGLVLNEAGELVLCEPYRDRGTGR
jgi:hypothetical protein